MSGRAAPQLTVGPVPEHGAVYTQVDEFTTHARFTSGTTFEWFGPFRARLNQPIYLRDTYGRESVNAGVHILIGNVFVTRFTKTEPGQDPVVEYSVLNKHGHHAMLNEEEATKRLRMHRMDDKLIFCKDHDDYKIAHDMRQRNLAY